MRRVARYSWLVVALATAGCSSSGVVGPSQGGPAHAAPTTASAPPNDGADASDAPSTGAGASNAPSTTQLQPALLAGTDAPNLGKNTDTIYRIGMTLYKTDGACAPMDQLADRFRDGGADFDAPSASTGFDTPAADGGASDGLLTESVEYYGGSEAAALLDQFRVMADQCRKPFHAPETGQASDSFTVQPAPGNLPGNCVAYLFGKAGQQPQTLYVVDQVGALLITFSIWSLSGPSPTVDPALIAAAEKKAETAAISGR